MCRKVLKSTKNAMDDVHRTLLQVMKHWYIILKAII